MKRYNFILLGRSGSGKGTQGALLQKWLEKNEPNNPVLYVQSGGELREFIKGETFTQRLAKDFYETGGLFPEFLSSYMWTNVLIRHFSGKEHLIIDGTPRKYHEAGALDSIFGFYNLSKPFVIYLKTDSQCVVDRLIKRGRIDDNDEDIKSRMAWFETDVTKAIDFYKNNKKYFFIEVDAGKTIDEIHSDIISEIYKIQDGN